MKPWASMPLLLVTSLGCAGGLASLLPCPDGFEDAMRARNLETSCSVLRTPARLVEESKAAFAQGDLEKAYDYLALVHTLHPQSEENVEAFLPAARLFARLNYRYRPQHDRWDVEEPRFMFGWLEQFFEQGEDFPQEQVDALFLGLRHPLFTGFLNYAVGRPVLMRWRFSVEKDNGIIQSVAGERVPGPVS